MRRRLVISAALIAAAPCAMAEVDFARDIRPILSDRCFKCHGFDEQTREADLGLHTFDEATRDLGGYAAIVPGDPDASELIKRITSDDPDEVMPPANANKPRLNDGELAVFRKWIEEGAKYEPHWAFTPPVEPEIPAAGEGWARNGIDRFIAGRLEAEGLKPAPQADPVTLLRRVSFDLIGLPPTPEEADAFLARWRQDPEQAWTELLDRLFASPHYGERWARLWLDLARYADTNGYEKDRERSIWPYRDWVIDALNADMPFDRFTVEQLAGDMLPDPTTDQLVATGFHRNTMLNEEGGIDPLEYRYHAMVDRVGTTGKVWMGLTIECAQCHTHKFDPITHTDYFSMMALLNNADEPEIAVRSPDLVARREALEARIRQEEARLLEQVDEGEFLAWLEDQKRTWAEWKILEPSALTSTLPLLTLEDHGVIFASGDFQKRDVYHLKIGLPGSGPPITALRLEALPDERLPAGGPGAAYYEGRSGDFFLSEFRATANGGPLSFAGASHDFGRIAIGSGDAKASNVLDGDGSTGWSTATAEGKPHEIVLNLAEPLEAVGDLEIELLFERHFVAGLGKFRLSATTATHPVKARPDPALDPLTSPERELKLAFARTAGPLAEARKPLENLEKSLPQFPTTLAMRERPQNNPRKTHRHHRGDYLSPEEEVRPATPAAFPPLPEGAPANRLTFARWLVDETRNPLIGRVTVNRAWYAFFGLGFVRSAADFGYQSDLPSHPELLDWLACRFVEDGWSLKRLHRLIVDSATYRQTSTPSPGLRAADPANVLLARAPRLRLEAEMIRDGTLLAGGLLNRRIGGPSVRPPQPQSVTAAAYGAPKWNAATGPERYRRSLYTFAKRTAPFAAYLTFDGPTGEACVVQRERSNTPLQALTLLNDPMFLEAASAMAIELGGTGLSGDAAARWIFRRVLTREPAEAEILEITRFHDDQMERLVGGELNPDEILGKPGASPETAAWAMVSRSLLNLDEAITRN
ncbi:PSD1 and planctomycete cytochrome C domain-containing protein [Haloferula sp. A504]|uniref:PSD1 and planctomycete cytochrome C domain-containing protein n=1 Tax=Haloferula sp. A504 TaxID=3373601 RepID=UPI0031C003C7|nr:PSD1 and planctomycete cytochrome C domain-containing protein [Verrucomicrobiaceae bacterium E54]